MSIRFFAGKGLQGKQGKSCKHFLFFCCSRFFSHFFLPGGSALALESGVGKVHWKGALEKCLGKVPGKDALERGRGSRSSDRNGRIYVNRCRGCRNSICSRAPWEIGAFSVVRLFA